MTTTRTPTTLTDADMDVMRILHSAFRRDGTRLADAAEGYAAQDDQAHEALLLGWHGLSTWSPSPSGTPSTRRP